MVCPRAAGRKSFRNRADGALEPGTGAGKMACMECLISTGDRVNPPVDLGSASNYDENMNQYYRIPCINNQGNLIMSLLELPCVLVGNRGRTSTVCLFDSGASYSVIRKETAEQIAHLEALPEPLVFETADTCDFITANYVVVLEFFLEDAPRRFTDEFMVLDTISEDLIIGATTMQKWGITLDFVNEKVIHDRKMHRLRI